MLGWWKLFTPVLFYILYFTVCMQSFDAGRMKCGDWFLQLYSFHTDWIMLGWWVSWNPQYFLFDCINTATWQWFCPMIHFPRCTSTSGHCFSMAAKIEGFRHQSQCGPPAPTAVLSRSLLAGSQSSHICPRSSRRCGQCLRLPRVPEFLFGVHYHSLFCATCSTHCRIWGGIKIVNWAFFHLARISPIKSSRSFLTAIAVSLLPSSVRSRSVQLLSPTMVGAIGSTEDVGYLVCNI